MSAALDPEYELAHLKDFQRATVEHVFARMYLQAKPRLRFLIADEVGLGKTLVARGLVAKVIHRLQAQGAERIDIIYVCSNAAIAAQNIARLHVSQGASGPAQRTTQLATRLTLLPLRVGRLAPRGVNFISFTPGTTFDLKSSLGVVEERALLWYALRTLDGLPEAGLGRLLRCHVGESSWRAHTLRLAQAQGEAAPHDALLGGLVQSVQADQALWQELCDVARDFEDSAEPPSKELHRRRIGLIGKLRGSLATSCLQALEPDLIILDEFQRFKHLIDPTRAEAGDTSAQLAMALVNGQSARGTAPRTLLLSATPYKMYTVQGEVEDDHYKDFLATMNFLFNDTNATSALACALQDYRRGLERLAQGASDAADALAIARDTLQEMLLSVMVRTERVGDSIHRDAMMKADIEEVCVGSDAVGDMLALDGLRRALGAQEIIEYWKSAPYLLSFMKGYDLVRRLDQYTEGQPGARQPSEALRKAVHAARTTLLPTETIQRYLPLEPRNGRMHDLLKQIGEERSWALLWIPPSLPYLTPAGRYENCDAITKSLLFSSWHVVPDVVAALSSYEAERRMLGERTQGVEHAELTRSVRGLLRFAASAEGSEHERFTGMGALLLGYPSPTLAALGDPLAIALEAGAMITAAQARDQVIVRLREHLDRLPLVQEQTQHEVDDPRWYWVALASLDAHFVQDRQEFEGWLRDPRAWRELLRPQQAAEGEPSGFDRVLDRFVDAVCAPPALRRRPKDLEEVLATLALGGPAVCALRALQRQAPGLASTDPTLLTAAAQIGEGFRTLFNVPESMALLRAGDEDAWRAAAAYGVEGNLQAVLDEHLHTLREALGLFGRSDAQVAQGLGASLAEAMSLRTGTLHAHDRLEVDTASGYLKPDTNPMRLRTRFGMRFGDPQDDQGAVQRADHVRKAFNTPFRPFLLASTSVGQEGLDFHTWCHRVVHWNIPTNPVDLEQREGRVHRYKGLAVRRNIARRFGLAGLSCHLKTSAQDGEAGPACDPWEALFTLAKQTRQAGRSDLVPYWIYDELEAPTRVQRYVPLWPLSREWGRYAELKKQLVLYRLAFGQPRQEDLVSWLCTTVDKEEFGALASWQLNLSPLDNP